MDLRLGKDATVARVLRDFGWRIASRPEKGEAVWQRDGIKKVQSEVVKELEEFLGRGGYGNSSITA